MNHTEAGILLTELQENIMVKAVTRPEHRKKPIIITILS